MTNPPNPINSGFRAVLCDPVIVLLEVLWRWSFAMVAFFLVLVTGMTLLGSLPIGDSLATAWRLHDVQMLGFIGLNTVLLLGKKLIVIVVVLPFVIAIFWSILAAFGRSLTVRRLRPSVAPLHFRSMLALQALRGFFAWLCSMSVIAALSGAAYLATRHSKPDLFVFYQMALPSIVLISIFWLVMNWYLTMATIFGRQGQSFKSAFRQGRQTVRKQLSDFAGTGFIFLLLRIVLLLAVLAVCGLTSSMMTSAPQTYTALLAVVAFTYFAVSDFLYISRMASYLALAAAYIEPPVIEPSSAMENISAGKFSGQ